ncbi:hypothetical protein LOY41_12315 [Pseudomonas atacamensis]|uniref:hypothetical protein n=1 Tax=Pseudomonas atacamensis TaxID=2565368 RepID=UPI00215FE2BA|nr:hypothetical protein [Pseudomonas atacamensis]UVM02032.1 hypothetical protein LOY41_12315 [Pseudomonas atacamensis]
MRDIDEVMSKGFNIPKRYLAAAYLFVTMVLAFGIGISFWTRDWMWLARFGAFLVFLAMISEVTGILDKYVKKIMSLAQGVTVEVVLMQVKRKPHLYGINPKTSEQHIIEISEKEHKRRLALANDVIQRILSKKIKKHAFFVASVGTMLWAFADLLNKL